MIRALTFSFFFFLFSCTEQSENNNYYPVNAWVSAELKIIDSLDTPIRHMTAQTGDTSTITIEAFSKIANGLLKIDFDNQETREKYKEEVLDEGDDTNISIIYIAKENSRQALRKIQLNIKPGQSSPKSIYAERIDLTNEWTIVRKLIWESKHSLTVASLYYLHDKLIREAKEKFEWGL